MYFLLSSNPQITIISFDFFLLALVYTSHGIIDVLMWYNISYRAEI